MAPRDGDGGVISTFERLRTEFNALRDGNKHRQVTLNTRLVSENVQLSKQNAEIGVQSSDNHHDVDGPRSDLHRGGAEGAGYTNNGGR